MNDDTDNAYNEGYRAGRKDAAAAAGKAVSEGWAEAHREGYVACLQGVKQRLDQLVDLLEAAAAVNGPDSAKALRGAVLATRTAFSDLGFPHYTQERITNIA